MPSDWSVLYAIWKRKTTSCLPWLPVQHISDTMLEVPSLNYDNPLKISPKRGTSDRNSISLDGKLKLPTRGRGTPVDVPNTRVSVPWLLCDSYTGNYAQLLPIWVNYPARWMKCELCSYIRVCMLWIGKAAVSLAITRNIHPRTIGTVDGAIPLRVFLRSIGERLGQTAGQTDAKYWKNSPRRHNHPPRPGKKKVLRKLKHFQSGLFSHQLAI